MIPLVMPCFFSRSMKRKTRSSIQKPSGKRPPPKLRKFQSLHLAKLREELDDLLDQTVEISFIRTGKLDSPFFDETKSTSYYRSCFEVVDLLGSGSFGAVYKCRQKEDGKLYAIKEIKERLTSLRRRDVLSNEVQILETLPPHTNVVAFQRAWQEERQLYIQMELCQEDLAKVLKSLVETSSSNEEIPYLKPTSVPEKLCWRVLIDILKAAGHLHRHGVLHLDIKPENVFVSVADGCFKLGDFGIAFNFIHAKGSEATEGDGRYAAPETIRLELFTPKADSYSIGATVLQFAMGILNPTNARHQDTWTDLKFHPEKWRTLYAQEMSGKSDDLWNVLRRLLASNHLERPSPEELFREPEIQSRNNYHAI